MTTKRVQITYLRERKNRKKKYMEIGRYQLALSYKMNNIAINFFLSIYFLVLQDIRINFRACQLILIRETLATRWPPDTFVTAKIRLKELSVKLNANLSALPLDHLIVILLDFFNHKIFFILNIYLNLSDINIYTKRLNSNSMVPPSHRMY